jgi:tight adherence protein B
METLISLTGADNSLGGYVVYAGTFLGILLFVTGLMQLLGRGEKRTEAQSRRMKMIAQGKNTPELLAILKPKVEDRAFYGLPFLATLPKDLAKAGILVKPRRFVILCVFVTSGAGLIASAFMPLLSAVCLAPLVGFGIPLIVVHRKKTARMNRLTAQLPDALDLMSRGLSVGHPLNTSIGSVAADMPDPIGTEFGIIFDQISFGDDLTDAVQEFADRMDIEDVHYLAASIGIQHGTGGDLARVTRMLGETVRNRIAMRRRIHSISSEGRLTAQFLSALPIGIFLFSSVTEPNYYGGIKDDPLFPYFVTAVVGCTVLNYLVLRHLVNFRI